MVQCISCIGFLSSLKFHFKLQDGCCTAYKMKIVEELPDGKTETMWLSRHGTAGHDEESWMNYTCSGEVSKKRLVI